MKAVIIDTFNYYDLRTKYVYEVLVEKGYEVTFLSSDFEHLTKSYRVGTRINTVFLHTKAYHKNLSFARIQSHKSFAKEVYKELCVRKPDLIYSLLPLNSLAKYIHKYKKGHPSVKVYFDIYDLWPESMPINHAIKKLLFPWRNLRDKHLKCAEKIFLECEYYKRFLPANLDYTVVYLCKEKREIEYKHDGEVLRFLYLGSINNIIDINGIVNLLSEVSKQRLVCLEIVGGGEKKDELVEKLAVAGIDIEDHGKIFGEREKDMVISHCHFGINMYKPGLCIGLTMKSLDYFCRGLPIISSNIYDTEKILSQYNCGISLNNNELPKTLVEVLSGKWNDFHDNCLRAFNDHFLQSNIINIFKNNIGGC